MMSSVINFLIMKTTINSLITMTMINSLSFVIWLWRLKRKLKRGRRNGSMRECHGILMSRSCVMRTHLKRLIECPFEPLRSWFTCWRVMSLGISPSAVQLLPFTQRLLVLAIGIRWLAGGSYIDIRHAYGCSIASIYRC